MRYVLSAVLLLCLLVTKAQDRSVDDLKSTYKKELADDTTHKQGWKRGATISLGLAQGNTSNWAAGAERSSLALNGYVNLFANMKDGRRRWMNNLELFYAIQNNTSQGFRKNDDRIDLYSKYTYQLNPKWAFGVVGNLRTQFTDGFDYGRTPKERTSGFLAPALMTIAPGFDWTPTSYFNVFMSPLSARLTYVRFDELAERYGVDPGKKSRWELGAFVSASFNRDIMKNVNLKSRLDLYSNYLSRPQNVDVFWTNVLTLKVNKWLGVTYNFDLIYDDDARLFGPDNNAPRTQIKSLLSVGLTTKL